jgi:hypothetical protein
MQADFKLCTDDIIKNNGNFPLFGRIEHFQFNLAFADVKKMM